MSLDITIRCEGTDLVLELDGFITLGAGSVTLRNEMQKALVSDAPFVVLNCERVEFVDSSGLAEFVSAHVHLEKLGRKLVLRNVDWRLHTVLDVTRLSTVLHIEPAPQPVAAPIK